MDSMNLHAHYPDVIKHWSHLSERFAGGDALLTKLRNGWDITTIYAEEFWHAGTRPVMVYHFVLLNGDEEIVMPVISTPYVRRMIFSWNLEVRAYDELRAKMQKQRRIGAGV